MRHPKIIHNMPMEDLCRGFLDDPAKTAITRKMRKQPACVRTESAPQNGKVRKPIPQNTSWHHHSAATSSEASGAVQLLEFEVCDNGGMVAASSALV